MPFNHYCRKNLGYLYSINNNTDIIFDTDDDNYPLNNFNSWNKFIDNSQTIVGPKFPNVMSLFTKLNIPPWPPPPACTHSPNAASEWCCIAQQIYWCHGGCPLKKSVPSFWRS